MATNVNNVIINGTQCVVSGSNNSKYRFEFNGTQNFSEGDEVFMSKCNIYYSWFNIHDIYNNKSFSYTFLDSTGNYSTYTINFDNCYLSIADIGEAIISTCTANGHYTISTSSNGTQTYKYYIALVENSSYYGAQIKIYPLPNTLPSGTTIGTSTNGTAQWTIPTSQNQNKCPQIIIPSSNNFGKLIGFKAGSYPPTASGSYYTITSNICPQIEPVNNVLVTCNLIQNSLSTGRNDIIGSFTTTGKGFGEMIENNALYPLYIPISRGTFQFIDIQFFDQDFNELRINDTALMIILSIRKVNKLTN